MNALTVHKKLRSKLPQQKRQHVSPMMTCFSFASTVSSLIVGGAGFSLRKRKLSEVAVVLAESSCSDGLLLSECEHGRKNAEVEEEEEKEEATELTSVEFGGNEFSESVAVSEVTCVHQQHHSPEKSSEISSKLLVNGNADEKEDFCLELKDIDDVSIEFCSERCETVKRSSRNTVTEDERSESSKKYVIPVMIEPEIEKNSKVDVKDHSDLVCTENISYYEEFEFSSSSSSFVELQSELFQEQSSNYFSELSQSISYDESGSEFSEKSDEDSPHSPTYALLLDYRKQIILSRVQLQENSIYIPYEIPPVVNNENVHDMEAKISYELLRRRERRQVYLCSYGQEFGENVLELRSVMVHWIIEESAERKLEDETFFLAVSLLDRFLSKGHFEDRRNLEIAAIACLTLAVRIEENQPYNSVRQKNICVGSEMYSRCEVVAMEWLVQEVLCFQCAMPTSYNFLWFYLKAAKADAQVNKRAMGLAKLALLDHEQLCYWPSTIAAALVILASLDDESCHHIIELHVRSKDDDLPKCIESFLWLVKYLYTKSD